MPTARVFLLRLVPTGREAAGGLTQLLHRHAGLAPVDAATPPPVDTIEITPAHHASEALSLLDTAEAAQAARLRDEGARQAYVMAHAALRVMLARELGCETAALRFTAGPQGKPRLDAAGKDVHFSLARRPGFVALAIGDAPLGVDVEPVREGIDMAGISGRFFTPDEHAFVLAAPDARTTLSRFFGLWSRKEALVKAAGVGIDALGRADALKSTVTLANEEGVPRAWCLHQIPSSADCALAMAIELPGSPA